jgi:hypothetical protein
VASEGTSVWERASGKRDLRKDTNRLSKYAQSIHNNCIKYLRKDTNRLVDCEHSCTGMVWETLTNAYLSKYARSVHNN